MNLPVQGLAVAVVVAACFVYAAWTLMPLAWRNASAALLRRVPGLGRWQALRPKVQAGCGGCDGACAPTAPKGAAPVRFYRRTLK
jgi:ferrous iron transport protein B